MFHTNNTGTHIINSLWHGITENANADRVWMPQGYTEGRVASSANEIVIDAHVVEALDLSLGDTVTISSGSASLEFNIVGIGYHPLHVCSWPLKVHSSRQSRANTWWVISPIAAWLV